MHTQEEASAQAGGDGVDLPDDVANRMSLFYANPTPMLHTLSGAAEKLLQEVGQWALIRITEIYYNLTYDLSLLGTESWTDFGEYDKLFLSHGLRLPSHHWQPVSHMTSHDQSHDRFLHSHYSSRFKSEETQMFCLRVMVGVIILFDHVHPVGAFAVKAAIDVRSVREWCHDDVIIFLSILDEVIN